MQKRSSENKGSGFEPCYACFQTTSLGKPTAFGSQSLIGYYNLGSTIQTAASATMDAKLMIMIKFKNKIDI